MTEITKEKSPQKEEEGAGEKVTAGAYALWRPCLAIFLAGVLLDHLTKFWAIVALKPESFPQPRVTVIPGLLQFVYAENTGAAFSFLTGQTFVLGLISVAAAAGLSWFWYSLPARENWGRVATALVLSGAIGNMIDRFARGYVVDFIDAYWREHHWPTFNIADSLICIGAVILVTRFLQKKI